MIFYILNALMIETATFTVHSYISKPWVIAKFRPTFIFDNPYPSYDRKRYFYFIFQCIEKSNFLKDVYSKTNRWPRSNWQNSVRLFFSRQPLLLLHGLGGRSTSGSTEPDILNESFFPPKFYILKSWVIAKFGPTFLVSMSGSVEPDILLSESMSRSIEPDVPLPPTPWKRCQVMIQKPDTLNERSMSGSTEPDILNKTFSPEILYSEIMSYSKIPTDFFLVSMSGSVEPDILLDVGMSSSI